MINIKEYKIVESLEQAYELNQKRSNIVIGGMCWIKMQTKNVNVGIDLSGLGLDTISQDDQCFKIGAMVTLRDMEMNLDISNYFGDGIKESLRHIIGVQFRNCATVGGSIRMRFGFSDVLTALMALGSKVELYKKGIIDLEEYAQLEYDRDIIVNIIIPKKDITMKYMSMRNSYTDFPVLAVAVARDENGFSAAVGSRPQRAKIVRDTENILSENISQENIESFSRYVTEQLVFGTNRRGTKGYRKHLSQVLIERCIKQIVEV